MTRDQFAFEDILEEAEQLGPLSMAVTHPCSEESLLGAVQAAQHGIITPILVAPLVKLQKTAAEFGVDLSPYRISTCPTATLPLKFRWNWSIRARLLP